MIRSVVVVDDLAGHQPWRRTPKLFFALEVLLALSIPLLGYLGLQALLDTKSGNFVTHATPDDPGWLASVEASPITGIVEILDGRTTGVTLVAQSSESVSGGAVIFVWPTMLVGGVAIADIDPTEVIDVLADELNLLIPTTELLDEARWVSVLGDETRIVENPDPIADADGEPIFQVGTSEIGAHLASGFIGLTAVEASPEAVIARREIWWEALLANPPSGEDDLAALMRALSAGAHETLNLPTIKVNRLVEVDGEPDLEGSDSTSDNPSNRRSFDRIIDQAEAQETIADYVPFPVGFDPGDRLKVRILGRIAGLDLEGIARSVAREGFEIVQIGNLSEFADGPHQVLVPAGVTDERANQLADLFDADTVELLETTEQAAVITLTVGSSAPEMSTP